MQFQRGLDLFLTAKRGELASQKTITYYEHWARGFFRYAIDNGAYNWESVQAGQVQGYLSMLKEERKLKSASVHDCYRALRAINRWLFKNNYIAACIMDKVDAPKQEKVIPRTFSIEEIKSMLGACDRFTFSGVRDKTMLVLLLSSGIRKSELAGILSENVDIEHGFIKVYGKGSKERIIPIAVKVKNALLEYQTAKRSKVFPISSKYYFVNNQGGMITESAMSSIFKRIKEKSGLQGARVSCHTWRHTFAKNYLMNGGDIFSLQKLLGHSDLTTTKRYLNLNTKELETQFDKYNPVDNLTWVM